MLSIIVPTYNEASNIEELTRRIFSSLDRSGIPGEVIFVDDASPDGTGQIADRLKEKYKVKVLHRKKRLGLASAVAAGFSLASGEILAVMDADLSHPPEVIPKMYKTIMDGEADFVIGSRLVSGGGSTDWSWPRKAVSSVARLLARPITTVKDLTSGYFMIKRNVIEGVHLKPIGFKICLEIIAKGNYNRIKEVPITFVGRSGEKSKLGLRQIIEYMIQVFCVYGYVFKRKIKGKG